MIQFNKNGITVFQSALFMTTSAVIQNNEYIVLADPNWLPHEVAEIREYINGQLGDRQLYIIYTHSDFDHIIGSGAFPEAKVIATERFMDNPNREEKMRKIHQFDQGYYLQRNYQPEYPAVDVVVSNHGQKLELGSMTLTFYLAPGHTHEGLFTVIEPYGVFLSGDYLSDVEFPFIYSSYKDYVSTMETAEKILAQHSITTHIPGHGTTTENEAEMQNRLNLSKHYLTQLVQDHGELENFLRKNYTFYDGIKEVHEENKKIAKRETMN